MSLSVISPSPLTSEKKSTKDAIAECAFLIASCAAEGEYINPYTIDNLAAKEQCQNSRLFVKYDSDDNLLGCLLMTDKDFCEEGLESKEFLTDIISLDEGIDFTDKNVKVFWISSVCTSPEARKTGCASRLFECAEKMALLHPSDYTFIAEAVRIGNDNMMDFSENKGYSRLNKTYTEEDFGASPTLGTMPWNILYKALHRPQS